MDYKKILKIAGLAGIAFIPIKKEVIERNKYEVLNEFLDNYYFVRAIKGQSTGYIHVESDEKINEGDNIILETIILKSLIGFEYQRLRIDIEKDPSKIV